MGFKTGPVAGTPHDRSHSPEDARVIPIPRDLNNALLLVFGVLVNNRIPEILDPLDHPNLMGGYTELFPHYVFGVLFGKVEILRNLGRRA